MRLIDANKIEYEDMLRPRGNGNYEECQIAYRNQIEDIPTADAVEIVRCEECIYRDECSREVLVNEYDDKAVDITGFLFYCSYGEKAEG